MKKIRVLHCINSMGSGGAEKDIMNWFEIAKDEGVIFDFLLRKREFFYSNEIKSCGGKIYVTPPFPNKLFENILCTRKFFINNIGKYDVVHVHGNSLFYIVPLIYAKKVKIPIRIFHAHNTKSVNMLSTLIHYINRLYFKKFITTQVACSKSAANFCNMDNPIIIKNAIDIGKYGGNKAKSHELTEIYAITDGKKVFANIGRMLPVKNQKFVIEIFKEINKRVENSILLIVGSGPLYDELVDYRNELGMDNVIFFLGEVNYIPELLQVIDLIIFPSLYEGVPLTLLEAQASKTKIVASDTVDLETKITNYLSFHSLGDTASNWSNCCIDFFEKEIEDNIEKRFEEANYNLRFEVNKLEKIYLGEGNYEK